MQQIIAETLGVTGIVDKTIHAGDRRGTSTTTSYVSTAGGWQATLVAATAATAIGADGQAVLISAVRVAGTANLGGACTIAQGTVASNTLLETIAATAAPGTELAYGQGTEFPSGCVVTVATSGTVLVLWRYM